MSNEELVKLIQDGDGDAVLQLWEQVEKFITMQAKKFLSCRVGVYELEDLQQSGFLAMLRAAKEYSPERDAVFLTYLDYWLKAEFPRSCGLTTRRIIRSKDGETITTMADPICRAESLDKPLSADDPGGDTLADLQPDPRDHIAETERRIYLEQLRQQLKKALATLPEEQRAVIQYRYLDGMTQTQTGEEIGITRSETNNLERKALITLRKRPSGLEQFIDDRTPFYAHVGVRQFTVDRESIVEKCVFRRERIRKEYDRQTDGEME